MGTPLGVLFNNPLNVRPGGGNWQGILRVEQTQSGQFLHMVDAPYGWRLAAANIIAHQDKWGHNTIATLIGGSGVQGHPDYRPGWAPPEDNNDTASYLARVTAETGINAFQPLNFHDYNDIRPVMLAMARVEQGGDPRQWWTDAQIDKGLELAGVRPPAKPLPVGRIITAIGTTGTVAAGNVITPSAPPAPMPTAPGLPSTLPIDQAQSILQMLAPYFKWAGIALMVLIAGAAIYYWWRQHQKRAQGVI